MRRFSRWSRNRAIKVIYSPRMSGRRDAMSIGKAVRDLIEARGLRPAEVADRLGGKRNRATFYRLLSGETNDPRVSTLLQLAGLLQYQERSLKLIDVELRQAFGEMQQLDEDDKRLCLALLRSVI